MRQETKDNRNNLLSFANVLLSLYLFFGIWQEINNPTEEGREHLEPKHFGRESEVVDQDHDSSSNAPNDEAISAANANSPSAVSEVNGSPEVSEKETLEEIQNRLLSLPPGSDSRSELRVIAQAVEDADAEEMVTWLEENDGHFKDNDELMLLSLFTNKWAEIDFEGASDYLLKNEDLNVSQKQTMIGRMLNVLYRRSDERAVEAFIESIASEEIRDRVWFSSRLADRLIEDDRQALFDRLDALEDVETRESAVRSVTSKLIGSRHRVSIINDLLNSELPEKNEILMGIGSDWIAEDMNAGLEWVGSLSDAELRGSIITMSWESIADVESETARAWIDLIEDEDDRASAIEAFNRQYSETGE